MASGIRNRFPLRREIDGNLSRRDFTNSSWESDILNHRRPSQMELNPCEF